jgi:biopolymer transport protein ExbB
MEYCGRIVWAIAREELRLARGLRVLTAIAYSAPMAGILVTCFGIFGSFRGTVGNADEGRARVMWSLAEAVIPTAAGLLIGIFAMASQRYLRSEVTALVEEMLWYRRLRDG